MSCPTCDHTMEMVGDYFISVAHCPRCGTLTVTRTTTDGDGDEEKLSHHSNTYVPKLVERCREFERGIPTNVVSEMREWKRIGIAEAINKPEERP